MVEEAMLEVAKVNNVELKIADVEDPHKSRERKEMSSSGSARTYLGRRW
jgi:hypothetical protein